MDPNQHGQINPNTGFGLQEFGRGYIDQPIAQHYPLQPTQHRFQSPVWPIQPTEPNQYRPQPLVPGLGSRSQPRSSFRPLQGRNPFRSTQHRRVQQPVSFRVTTMSPRLPVRYRKETSAAASYPPRQSISTTTAAPFTTTVPTPTQPVIRTVEPPKTPNLVEIICVGFQQLGFAEEIENELKEMHLTVDIMFADDPTAMKDLVGKLFQEGTAFILAVGSHNSAHRSVTAHILKESSKPEEHRNMPVEHALDLIKAKLIENKRRRFGGVPKEMTEIMNAVMGASFLTDAHYQALIGWIQKRWKFQRQLDNRVDFDKKTRLNTQLELMNRVMKIMGVVTAGDGSRPSGSSTGSRPVPPPPAPPKFTPTVVTL